MLDTSIHTFMHRHSSEVLGLVVLVLLFFFAIKSIYVPLSNCKCHYFLIAKKSLLKLELLRLNV